MLTEQETEYYLKKRKVFVHIKVMYMWENMSQFVRAVFQSQAHSPSVLLMCNNQTMPFFSKTSKTLIMQTVKTRLAYQMEILPRIKFQNKKT